MTLIILQVRFAMRMRDFVLPFNMMFFVAYGLTEMIPVSMSDPLVTKLDSAGTIAPNTVIKV